MKKIIQRVLRERTLIAAVLTAVVIELQADFDNPDFHWRDVIIGIVGIGLRFFVTPYNKPKE